MAVNVPLSTRTSSRWLPFERRQVANARYCVATLVQLAFSNRSTDFPFQSHFKKLACANPAPKKARPPTGLSARPPDKVCTDPRLDGTQSGRGHRAYQLRQEPCGSARFVLRGEPFHGAGGPYGLDGLRFTALLGAQLGCQRGSEMARPSRAYTGLG
jgi:hypothetical protein